MTVTKKDILAIKPGRSKAFVVEKPQSIKTAMAMCTYIKNMRQLPEKVERYSCPVIPQPPLPFSSPP